MFITKPNIKNKFKLTIIFIRSPRYARNSLRELCTEQYIGIVEHTIFQRHDYEL